MLPMSNKEKEITIRRINDCIDRRLNSPEVIKEAINLLEQLRKLAVDNVCFIVLKEGDKPFIMGFDEKASKSTRLKYDSIQAKLSKLYKSNRK